MVHSTANTHIMSCSVYLASGLGSIFGRFNLPAFNLPFNVAAFMFLAAVRYSSPHSNAHFPLKPGSPLMPNETFQEADLDWAKVQCTHPFHRIMFDYIHMYSDPLFKKVTSKAIMLP